MKKLVLVSGIALLIAGSLAGCAGAPKTCSTEILSAFATDDMSVAELPVPEIATGSGVYCSLGVEQDGQTSELVIFSGTDPSAEAKKALTDHGFTADATTQGLYNSDKYVAYVVDNGTEELKAGDGVPEELVGKIIAIVSVAPATE